MRRLLFFSSLSLLAACADPPTSTGALPVGQVGLNDTAMLFPLPKSGEEDMLLRPTDEGAKGKLLPDWALPGPALVMLEDRRTTIDHLRLVGIRIDPCSPVIATTDLSKCTHVLHLLWQPVVAAWEKGATTMSTADAAVHNFHTLSRDEMTSLLEAVVALGETYPVDPKLPLQVHPVLASQGLSGALWPKIKDIVLEYAGETNLTRMTFMALRANIGQDTRYLGVGWLFSGAELGGATTQRVVVATTTDNEQHFGNNASGASIEDQADFVGDVIPGTKSTDVLLRILADSKAAMALPEADIQAAVDQTFKIENPTTNTLDSIDCVSCHVATTARAWAAENRGIKTDSNPYRYTSSTFDLTLVSDSEDRSNCLRGFGYYGVHSAISQRTVNDTAAGADFINTYFLRRQ